MGKTQTPSRALQNIIFGKIHHARKYWANSSIQQNFYSVMEQNEC